MTQLFPNPSVAVSHRTGGSGSRLKLLRLIAMLSLLVATEAAAQAPRMPAPMPLFRAPIVTQDGGIAPDSATTDPTGLPAGSIPLPAETATQAIETVTADPQPVRLTAYATDGIDSPESLAYREQLNSAGSPSTIVGAGYHWRPGTELIDLVEPSVVTHH